MRCQKASPQDIPQLKSLWEQAFRDSQADIEGFFAQLYPACVPFVSRDGDKVVGMVYALPISLFRDEESCSAAYLYAVATDEAYRGQGVCRELLAYAETALRKKNFDLLLLSAADEELVGMYRKLGYTGGYDRPEPVEAPVPAGKAQQISTVEYGGLRETLLWDQPHARYSKAILDYEAQDAGFYALRLGAAPGCAVIRRRDGKLHVLELLPDRRFLPALAELLDKEPALLHSGVCMKKPLTPKGEGWQIELPLTLK